MAVQFKVPASPARSTLTIDTFLGADFTNDPANVDIDKSPDLLNMIRDVPGKVRKTMGYKTIATFDGTINGYHTMRGKSHGLVHVGNKLYYGDYDDPTLLYSDANNNRSRSWQFKATQVAETKTAPITDGVADFEKIDGSLVKSLVVEIEPVQNLNGYSKPWVGGAGKNKASNVQYMDAKSKYATTISASYTLKAGKRYVLSWYTQNTGIEIYRQSPTQLGFDSLSEYSFVCDGTRKSMYGTAIADFTKEPGSIIARGTDRSTTGTGLCYDFQIEEVGDTETQPTAYAPYSNICPISGHTEVDLYNVGKNWFNKDNYKFVKNSYIDANNAWVGNTTILTYPDDALSNYWNSVLIDLTPYSGKTITYSGFVSQSGTNRGLLDKDFNVLAVLSNSSVASKTVDLSQYPTAKYLALAFIKSSYNFDSAQLELGSTATSYEPYHGKTYTTPFNQTVYGGTLDVLTGELTIDKGFITLNGTENISKSAITDCDIYIFGVNDANFQRPFITSAFEYSSTAVNAIGYAWRGSSEQQIRMGYAPYGTTTVQDFKDWLSQNPLQICYALATPTTLSLTPQTVKALVGENHIQASTGDVTSCTYTETVSKDRVCILDGKALLLWDGDTVTTAAQNATIPVTMIGGSPAGGGTSYYPLNLLSPGFTEQFLGTAADKDYQLSYTDLDSTEVRAEVLQNDGTWLTKVEGTDFTVDRETGVVSFIVEPGESPVTGEDNVKITAFKTVVGYSDRINKCSVGILYGASGDLNRLFVSGNPDYVNYQWYSDTDDPTYFPDTNYMLIGTAKSAIVGYAISGSYLAVFKDGLEVEQNVTLVSSTTLEGQTIFATYSTIHGEPAISPDSFQVLSGEPLFLTALGVYALTSQDVIGKEITNLRSFYLNGRLLEEQYLEKAYTFVYKDFYIIAVNQKLYILDGLQAVQTDKSAPYSTRQFIGYYRTGVDANVMWEEDGALCFGTLTGKVCKFYTDPDNINNYNDDGEPIHARWETPDIDGKLFYKNKTFRFLAIRLKRSLATSVKIFSMKRGLWSLITDTLQARYLCFWNITFSKFSFSTDKTSRTLTMKIRIKKVDKARFRFENDVYNESFALDKIGLEFVEKGNFKS